MSRPEDRELFSEDLQEVADVLPERRPELEPVKLDRIKLRAMSGACPSTSSKGDGFFVRSRLATVLAVGFLMLGTGGPLAVAGGGSGGQSRRASGSWYQYRPPCKDGSGYGNDRRCHPGPPGHYWHHHNGWCCIEDGHGGYRWGYGNGWVYE